MKAKLVYATVITRVIVEDDATEDEIIKAAKPRLISNLTLDTSELIEKIKDDIDSPYNPLYDRR